MGRWCAVLLMLGFAACTEDTFICREDGECLSGSVDGQCELSGYCSFPDEACPSGRRYGDLAGGGLAGTCVEPMQGSSGATGATGATGGVSDTAASSSPATTSGATSTTSASQGGRTCGDSGFFSGELGCTDACTIDATNCTNCGNGAVGAGRSATDRRCKSAATSCSSSTSVCTNAEVVCGLDACGATCEGDSAPDVSCNGSCECTACG